MSWSSLIIDSRMPLTKLKYSMTPWIRVSAACKRWTPRARQCLWWIPRWPQRIQTLLSMTKIWRCVPLWIRLISLSSHLDKSQARSPWKWTYSRWANTAKTANKKANSLPINQSSNCKLITRSYRTNYPNTSTIKMVSCSGFRSAATRSALATTTSQGSLRSRPIRAWSWRLSILNIVCHRRRSVTQGKGSTKSQASTAATPSRRWNRTTFQVQLLSSKSTSTRCLP